MDQGLSSEFDFYYHEAQSVIHAHQIIWWAVYQVFGLAPWPYRLVNILFHFGCSVLVYAIVRKIEKERVSRIASMLFAVHPLLTEGVMWIAGGIYTQYTFFFLMSFFLYLKGDKRGLKRGGKDRLYYLLSVLFYLISLLFNEKAISLFLIFLVYELSNRTVKTHWKRLIPFVIIGCGFILYYVGMIGGRLTGVAETVGKESVGFYNPLIQLPLALTTYLSLFFWPQGLSFYHSEFSFSFLAYIFRLILTILFFGGILWSFFKRSTLFFWVSWFIIGLLPVITPLQIAWLVAERYVYMSLIGVIVIVSIGFDKLISIKKLKIPVICFLTITMIALILRTVYRNTDWHNEDSLWTVTEKTAPSSPYTWNNLGDMYYRHKEYDKAIASFRRAIVLAKHYAPPYFNMGNVMQDMGEIGDATILYEQSIVFKPSLWQAYRELATIAIKKGEYERALELLKKGLSYQSDDPEMKYNYDTLQKILVDPTYRETHERENGIDILNPTTFQAIIATEEGNE